MKKHSLWGLFFALAWLPGPAHADYLVILRKGTEFVVPDYWVDREAVGFVMDGGNVAIPRNAVLYISEADDDAPGLTRVVTAIGFGKKSEYYTEELKQESEEKELGQDRVSTEPPPASAWDRILGEIAADNALREKGRRLMQEREEAKKAFLEAKSARDKKAQKEAGQKILTLNQERSRLLEDVRKANNGEIPAWWNEAM